MTVCRGHESVGRASAFAVVIAIDSKGGKALEEVDENVPLGNGGRLRPPLFFDHATGP
jgi:hypothetical protein